ncbi:polysaccharide biosynthesis protein [Roseateles amylovorans]|uniref:Polysaccharide biosynthesis protein n=1 Tax=Roseateles amylovorans TaxID=2978473 RepID=A0ABY6B0X9_9BURK|nr:nucleoside-diphosphate sugar epimerase/dehydratase [Roseateles amylovorans]UXH77644.1 polysaccharide biosynthesis protein [Roseateles amylovorans]
MNWLSLDASLTRIRPYREALALALDMAAVALAWQATYLFRLGFERWFEARPDYDHWVMLGIVVLYGLFLKLFHVPKGMWRFSGFGEVKRLAAVCIIAGLIAAVAVLMAQLTKVPRAVLALHPVFTLMALSTMRMGYRMLYEHMRSRISGSALEQRRALVMGAGDAGRLLVAGIQHQQGWVVVGYLDDVREKRGARVAGVPVLGTLEEAPRFAELHGITHVIVAMPAATTLERRRALDLAGKTGLPVLTVPSSQELLAGRAVNQVRDIEPEDLLGREPVQLDEGGISECIGGKTVLITGAGGSIGSELCRQVARYGPSRLVLLELSEFALYSIEQELGEKFPHIPLVRLIGDVKDLPHLKFVFGKYQPQIVFHAAAYKHVPLMEEENAWAALRNNTLGTYHACLAAAECGAERFVLISTDKAVNPTNVMGATKRAAELVISHMAGQGHATRFMAVRFGNVLGSSGSVIPKFKEQIAKGGPVTVTHPEITRYFMTIPEAARLVVQAGTMGESGQVFVLDMGEPVKIVDLARTMIRMSGKDLRDIPIEFSGLRPGEKLYEELLGDEDTTLPTRIARLRIALLGDQMAGGGDVLQLLAELAAGQSRREGAETRNLLARLPLSYSGRS